MDGNIAKPGKKYKKIIALVLVIAALSTFNALYRGERAQETGISEEILKERTAYLDEEEFDGTLTAAHSSGKVVMEVTTGRVLGGTNIHTKMEMASTTKVMTALVVVERCKLTDIVTIPKAAVGVEGSSIYLREGEKLTVKDLLYGLMLRSGNDAAVALALHAGGSIEGFSVLMNEKANELGLKNTHFTNPHGLHDDNHYTSAYDLCLISCVAMRSKVFSEIVGTKMAKLEGDGNRVLFNKNKFLFNFNGATGIKTGFTKAAGRCLVAGSKREGMELVSVVLNCGPMYEECGRLMENAYSVFEMKQIYTKGEEVWKVDVASGKENNVSLYINSDVYIPLKKDGSESYEAHINANNLTAPVLKDIKCGQIQISFADDLHLSENLYTINAVEKLSMLDRIKEFFKR